VGASGEVVVIVNPKSGRGGRGSASGGEARVALARAVLGERARAGRVEVTQSSGHARAIALGAASSGAGLVVAWGGDGTVSEVGAALAFGGTPLGIVPGGSGNGLARALGISLSPRRALEQALGGAPRAIDAGELAGRLFFNVAGIGFDAHVARIFNRSGHRRGFNRYLATSLIELFRYQARRYVLRFADRTIERRALMIVLANGNQYGNGARVAPQARLDDGVIDLVIVEPESPVRNVLRARYLFDGSIARRPGVLMERVTAVSIDSETRRMAFHADGESIEHEGPLDLRVHRHALNVVVPPAD
jgi:diacylglycerol kinase (ATP)